MPLYEFRCDDCGKSSEILMISTEDRPECPECGSTSMTKLLSAHSSMSGPVKNRMPGPGDTACCGSSPGKAQGCAGPGSCCGRSF